MTVVVVIIYYAFGTDFALLWGLLFFVMSFIPNIGFVTGGDPAVLRHAARIRLLAGLCRV